MVQRDVSRPITPESVEEQTKVLSETLPASPRPVVPGVGEGSDSRRQVERRAFARRRAKGKVTYQIGDWGAGPAHKAEVVDISQNGIGLITEKLLAEGTKLRILKETPYRGQKITVPGQVRWIAPISPNQFRVGCSLERRLQYTEMQAFSQ